MTPNGFFNTMGDNSEQQIKKQKPKWITSHSRMTIEEAEKRLGTRIDELKAVPVDRMLAAAKRSLELGVVDAIKERVYDRIVEHIEAEGYPTEANPDFKEANISNLVYSIITPIITGFRRKTRRNIRLTREKEIISTDNETGGMEEFVVGFANAQVRWYIVSEITQNYGSI